MRLRHIFVVFMMMICLGVLGQQSKKVSMQGLLNRTDTLKEQLFQLQAENAALHKQLVQLEKEIDLYRGDVRSKISELDESMSRWTELIFLLVTILTAGLGAILPLYINNRNDKNLKTQVDTATKQAEQAKTVSDDIRKEMQKVKGHVELVENQAKFAKEQAQKAHQAVVDAENAAKEAKVNQLFAKAENEGNPLKAIDLYNQVIKYKPDYYEAYFHRGIMKAKIENQTGALEDYNMFVEHKSDCYEAYFHRGNLKVKMGDQNGALEDYNMVIKLSPSYCFAYKNRGSLKELKGDQNGALDDYNRSIELNPNYYDAYNSRAKIYMKLGDLDKALENVNKAINGAKMADFYYTRGEIYMKKGKYDEAREDFDSALPLESNYTKARLKNAEYYRMLADLEQDPQKKACLINSAETFERIPWIN